MEETKEINVADILSDLMMKVGTYSKVFEHAVDNLSENDMRDFLYTYSLDLQSIKKDLDVVYYEVETFNLLSDKDLEMFSAYRELNQDYKTKFYGEILKAAATERIKRKEQCNG